MTDEAPTNKTADMFREMADRIETVKGMGFAGAFLIIPPDGGGEPVWSIGMDSGKPVAQFWANLKTRCEITIAELEDKQRQQAQPFGARR